MKNYLSTTLLLFFSLGSFAQQTTNLSLAQAIELGVKNSNLLKLSQAKIDQAVTQYNQTKDEVLPKGSANFIYNHAEIPTTKFSLAEGAEPFRLPSRADAFVGTASLQEVVFAGNRLRYARQSTELLTQVARLDASKDKEDIVFNITTAYYNLYKLQQSQKVVAENLNAINEQLKQAERFFEQGIVTKNDVLGFQLQQNNVKLSGLDLETNRKIVVYNLDLALGLPENTNLVATDAPVLPATVSDLQAFLDSALTNRTELQSLDIRARVADTRIKSLKAELVPSVILGANAYYINPSGKFIPPANSFIAPFTVGATVAWNFDRLWMDKNKVAEAKVQRTQVDYSKSLALDNVKSEVNQNYQNYQKSIERIGLLESSLERARENDRIFESKYRNNIASATDRIQAQTQLYQALISLELAKADAEIAYYTLLKSTGNISK